ncbi:MAG: molybdopterin-dependent oxidoreductase [bacterium]|nr:molybdopterin-dependent oxidoreductase [bacterium]
MPNVEIDGQTIEVDEGTSILEAAGQVGAEIPHYCYHPGLSIDGTCRMCLVEVEKSPKLVISCATPVAEGMVVRTGSEPVKKAVADVLEYLLINHPLDCPICDKAGECGLQDYYMEHGLYSSRMHEKKWLKGKVIDIGQLVLDQDRCILCTRCVRFGDEVVGDQELGFIDRSSRKTIATFMGQPLKNHYTGNLVDICPVGAFTDKDFRFQARVWYLERTESVCPGCSRGCNIEVHHTMRRFRFEHKRVYRLLPRYNPEVNGHWMCDFGRHGYHSVDSPERLFFPLVRDGDKFSQVPWMEAMRAAAEALRGAVEAHGPEAVAVIPSAQSANEDLFVLRELFRDSLGVPHIDYRVPAAEEGYEDEILIKADKNPNTHGCADLGLVPADGGRDLDAILAGCRDGTIKALVVCHHDLGHLFPDGDQAEALSGLEALVFLGSLPTSTQALASVVLPAAVYVEREGTFTNFAGRVQRFWQVLEPLGEAIAEWDIWVGLAQALGRECTYRSAGDAFDALAQAVEAYAGLSYDTLGADGEPAGVTVAEAAE